MPALSARKHVRAEQCRFQRAKSGQAWSVKNLPQFYYHKNFCDILGEVESKLSRLLDASDLAFLEAYRGLTFHQQCAYIRLSSRKGRIFDCRKLSYPEIENLQSQFVSLNNAGFTRPVWKSDFSQFLGCLNKVDLLELMSTHLCKSKFKKSWKKLALVEIARRGLDFDSVTIPKSYIVQCNTDILHYLLYLSTGRVDGSLQDITLRDLGLVKQSKSKRSFGERFETLETAKVAWFYAKLKEGFQANTTSDLSKMKSEIGGWPEPLCSRSRDHREKLLFKIGAQLERNGHIENALDVYSHSDSLKCNERIIRLRYKRGDKDWVKLRLEEIIEDPSSDEEYAFAEDFYQRKFKRKRTSAITDILRNADPIKIDEAFRNEPEKAVLRHFRERGFDGFRMENSPWRSLFTLLFWDELFPNDSTLSSIDGLMSGRFYQQNKESIETKLTELDTPHLASIKLLKTFTQNFGKPQNLFRWNSKSLDRELALLRASPFGSLAKIFRQMANDWNKTKDGFPDLMIIESGVARLIEVKAEGDIVRRNQLVRIRQLKAAGFKVDILRVNWTVDPNQTYVVVDVETTGGRAGLHRVTEIGAVKIRGGKIIAEWSSLINPQRSIPANITRLTGISEEMVVGAPIFAEVADSFEAFMGDAIFAAHNVNFDYGFMRAEFQMIDRKFQHPKICTCSSMRKLYPEHKSYSLKNLCQAFGIDLKSHHRALCDAKAAAELLFLVNDKRIQKSSED